MIRRICKTEKKIKCKKVDVFLLLKEYYMRRCDLFIAGSLINGSVLAMSGRLPFYSHPTPWPPPISFSPSLKPSDGFFLLVETPKGIECQ